MGQLTPRPNTEGLALGGIGMSLHMEECSVCQTPVTIVGSLPEVIRCQRCAANADEASSTD